MSTRPSTPARTERERERIRHVESLRFDGAAAVPALLAELVEPSWAVRRAVVAVLAAGDRETALRLCDALVHARDDEAKIAGIVDALAASKTDVDDVLVELTRSPNSAVVCDAAQILGRHESERALPALEALTAHADDNVALAAVEALGRIGGKTAVDSLLKLAKSGNFFRSFPAIDALGRQRDPRALETLVALAGESLYAPEAVRALGRLGDPAAASHLVRLAAGANESLVRNIALALVAIREQCKRQFGTGAAVERAFVTSPRLPALRQQLMQSVKRADPAEQLALGQVLAWIGDESTVPTLLSLLEGPGAVAQVAAASLKQLAGVAEPQLLEALRESTAARRRLLIPILGGRGSARDAFIACLEDEDAGVRALACDALARLSDPSAVPALFTLLGDPDARAAQAALGAIQSLGSHETRELALRSAGSKDERIRCAALRIIGYFAYPEGFAEVAGAANDANERVRDAAIGGLPLFDTQAASAALIVAAHHASMRTRTSAIRALGQTSGGDAVLTELRSAVADESPWVRYYACQSLGKLRDEEATALLAERLQDGSGQVQVAAVDALAHLRGRRAFEVLSATVGSADPDLHRAALVALGISKRAEALPQLLAAMLGDDAATRLVALSALAELGLPEVVPALARASDDRDEGVRVAATGFLAARSDLASTHELIALLVKAPEREALVQALRPRGAGPGRSHHGRARDGRRRGRDRARRQPRSHRFDAVARRDPQGSTSAERRDAPGFGVGAPRVARRRERVGARARRAQGSGRGGAQNQCGSPAFMTGLALSPQVFAILSSLIEERTGIHYGTEDRSLLADKLEPRVIERGFDSLLDYYYFLRYDAGADAEFALLVEALVVNETYFFREAAALEITVDVFLPELMRAGVRPRVWCAACATGEEPYTFAMLLDAAGLLDAVTLIASDISGRALAHAREAAYFRRSLRALPPEAAGRWLIPIENGMRVERHITDAVDFRRVNLIDQASVAALGQFDIVLCRNVLIYFSDETVGTVVAALSRALRPSGRLIVGASESLLRFESDLTCEERSSSFFYRKGAA